MAFQSRNPQGYPLNQLQRPPKTLSTKIMSMDQIVKQSNKLYGPSSTRMGAKVKKKGY